MKKQATLKRKKTLPTGRGSNKKDNIRQAFELGILQTRLQEGLSILLTALAAYLFIALVTYQPEDPGWSHTGMASTVFNAAGKTGAWISDVLYSLFGYVSHLFPMAILFLAVLLFQNKVKTEAPKNHKLFKPFLWSIRSIGLSFLLIASCGMCAMKWGHKTILPMHAGGVVGDWAKVQMIGHFNLLGASVLFVAIWSVGLTLFTGISWVTLFERTGQFGFLAIAFFKSLPTKLNSSKWLALSQEASDSMESESESEKTKSKLKVDKPIMIHRLEDEFKEQPKIEREEQTEEESFSLQKPMDIQNELPISPEKLFTHKIMARSDNKNETKSESKKAIKNPISKMFKKPLKMKELSLDLLEENLNKQKVGMTGQQIKDMSAQVEERLLEFGIKVQVMGVYPGPVITRFELQLAAGIKVSRLTTLVKDLARALSVISVRVVEVIPGKSYVGLEIPNTDREIVRLREILNTSIYQDTKSPLTMALGKDIAGRPMVVDLGKMPHLLVAGTTGSGKSVGLNAMLLSILFKASPDDVRMILIDPKMLELSVYDGIPHLLTPVVTDMKDAANALRWCVAEMERRYKLMAAMGVRNLAGYNQKIEAAIAEGKPIRNPLKPRSNTLREEDIDPENPPEEDKDAYLTKLPYIVVLVDEFADMIMVVGKKVEELITRIAQKARAAGIHLILATQRPSVDVITGLIKANIPTRIAFQVSSRIDSRTIMDQSGAEQLLGHGDMLYLPPGAGIPVRVHGAFVADDEVHRVNECLRSFGPPDYIENLVTESGNMLLGGGFGGEEESEEYDEYYDMAVKIVTESRKASISNVQRRLKIGYNRAARLIEQMEKEGIVSEMQTNGSREVLAPPPVSSH
jgi:S-DNA-T family DNA segregation ATPase FtsK/SpoIIIE